MYSWSRKRNKRSYRWALQSRYERGKIKFLHNTHADHQRRIDFVKEVRDELQLPKAIERKNINEENQAASEIVRLLKCVGNLHRKFEKALKTQCFQGFFGKGRRY